MVHGLIGIVIQNIHNILIHLFSVIGLAEYSLVIKAPVAIYIRVMIS